jgi:hypothetical protein
MMSQDLSLAHERADCPQALRRCGVLATVSILAWTCTASAGAARGSLQEISRKADELAATPAGRAQAIAAYEALIETHLANEALFDAALRQLARCYVEAGRAEEGIRFVASAGQRMFDPKRGNALRDIMREFSVNYPEQVTAAMNQMRSSLEEARVASERQETRAVATAPLKELSTAILQRDDADQREKALARLRTMLAAESSDENKKQGLSTLHSALPAKFGRGPFRELVLPLLQAKDPGLRALALRCLPGLDATIGDLALVLPLVADPVVEVREEVGPALVLIDQGRAQERVIPALTRLLRDPERSAVQRTLRSLWGQYSSPEFDELLIQLTRDREHHGPAIYNALSTMRRKSPAVCRRLVEELSDPDWNNSGRAAWGLTYGVTEEAKPLVEEGLLKALPQETNEYTRENELRALLAVGTEKCRPYLQSVIDSPLETDKAKQLAREVLGHLDRKP